MKLSFKSGYKYQSVNNEISYQLISFRPDKAVRTTFCTLGKKGVLVIKPGYAWDGPSGPTIDTDNFMIGSLIHDVLYELMRNELVPHNRWREADMELDHINKQCGMSWYRRWWVRKGLLAANGGSAKPSAKKEIKEIEYDIEGITT